MIDPRELAEFDAAAAPVEAAIESGLLGEPVVRLLQAARRILVNLEILKRGNPREAEARPIPSPVTRETGYTGDACRECGSLRMVRTGTCTTCQSCGANEGCG